MSDLLSFVSAESEITNGTDNDLNLEPGSIWDKLFKAITHKVKVDGIKSSAIRPYQTALGVTINAAENIYFDVAEFYGWYFIGDDERAEFVATQKTATIPSPLRAVVKPVVEYLIPELREADYIPEGMDNEDLVDNITDNLTRYILNWQDWYYDRKEQEEFEDDMLDKAMYQDIYESGYGDFTNTDNYHLEDDL